MLGKHGSDLRGGRGEVEGPEAQAVAGIQQALKICQVSE